MQASCLMVPRQCIGKPCMSVMKPIVVFIRYCDDDHHQSTLKSVSGNVFIPIGRSTACDMCNVTTYQSILFISRWLVRSGKKSPLRCKFEGYVLAYDETCVQVPQVSKNGNSTTTPTLVRSTLCGGLPPTTPTTGRA